MAPVSDRKLIIIIQNGGCLSRGSLRFCMRNALYGSVPLPPVTLRDRFSGLAMTREVDCRVASQ